MAELSTADDDGDRVLDDRPKPTFLWALLSGWLLSLEAWLRSHGGRALQYGIRSFWAVVGAIGVFLLVGPVINPPITLDEITSSASGASDRWIARDFAVEYTIETDSDGSLRAEVEERITAFFPDDVTETGIERVLATNYQGHSLAPSAIAATVDGTPIDVARSATADRLTLGMFGETELEGDHEYVLRYTLQDLAYEAVDEASGVPVDMLEWDVFGPTWPQGFAALDVRITLAEELDDKLIRAPRGDLAWTLLGAGDWLEPEDDSPAGYVSYGFTNEQNMPPHSQAWFTMPFEAGTFTMPPRSPLWWVQTFGPLVPLLFLGVTLLLALAARAVAWSDERGAPWYVSQHEPPKGVSARMAAHILREPAAFELASALSGLQAGSGVGSPEERRIAVARVATRTGRVGDRPRAWSLYLSAPERRQQLRRKLRRIPRGFVRDLFIAAPLALTLVQWGIVRQLSHQAKLTIVWWPVAFVLASTLIALVILAIALTAKPLTAEGALVKQHLLGLGVFAQRTQLLERAVSKDPALPYAVLLAAPRDAGRRIAELMGRETGSPADSSRWRTTGSATWPRMLLRSLALVIVVGAIAVTYLMPSPYSYGSAPLMYSWDLPGTTKLKVRSMEVRAELTRDSSDRARIDVSERLSVDFDGSSSRIPQFAQQWPNSTTGHELGLAVESVEIGGRSVPFETRQEGDTLLMVTTMVEVLDGTHDVHIDYTIASAAVAANDVGGELVDRVTWSALVDGWEHNSQWGGDPPINPMRLELRMPEQLAEEATLAGWLTKDTKSAENARDWKISVVPFGEVHTLEPRRDSDVQREPVTSESFEIEDGMHVYTLDLLQNEHGGYPSKLTFDDVGAMLNFAPGTFAGPDASALREQQVRDSAPFVATLIVGGIATVLGVAGILLGRLRHVAISTAGVARDAIRWFGPLLAAATAVLFLWLTSEMPESHPVFAPLAVTTLAAVGTSIASLVLTRRRKPR